MYRIDHDVPPPPPRPRIRPYPPKYPLATMHIGDSFFVPTEKFGKCGWRGIIAAVQGKAKKLGMKVSYITDETGIRVWRDK